MILEMKRALEDVKSGDKQGYRKIFDATYEEVYCRSFLILQKEEAAVDFMKGFFGELFGVVDEADDAQDQEKWLWQKYYRRMRKQYHRLLEAQEKNAPGKVCTLAEIPGSLPLLHRIMLVMWNRDDFTAGEISAIYGIAEDKIRAELEKLDKALPILTKDQPESVAGYLSNWRVLLLGASRQISSTGSYAWVDQMYQEAVAAAGIVMQEEKKEDFNYFVADVDLTPQKPKKKPVPVVEEEPEYDDEDDDDDDDRYDDEDDDEYDDDEYDDDEDDEYDDDDEDDDRYDWDIEDDGKRMIIIGVVMALAIVLVIGIGAFFFLNRDKGKDKEKQQDQTEQDADAELIIRGDSSDGDDGEPVEGPEEEGEEEPEEPAEPETVLMKVNGSSVNVRGEASTDSDVVGKVRAGEQVEVLGDASGEWVQIRCVEQDNEEGYVKTEFLSAVE